MNENKIIAFVNAIPELNDFTAEAMFNRLHYHSELKKIDPRDYDKIRAYIVAYMKEKGIFSIGNDKLSENIAIFSLYPVTTCNGRCCDCCKYSCYACDTLKRQWNASDKRYLLTWLALFAPDDLEQLAVNELNKILRYNSLRNVPVDYVRIHESGDFFDQYYVDIWTRVAAAVPGLRFYYYTKANELYDFASLNDLDNVNGVNSTLPDGDKNYGSLEYVQEKRRKFKIPVCAYGFKDKHGNICKPACGTGCTLCMRHRYVLFLDHSCAARNGRKGG